MITVDYIPSVLSYNTPWNQYIFKASDPTDLLNLSIGQEISNITYVGGIPNESGSGSKTILSFLYENGIDLYLDPAPGRSLVGFIAIDGNNTLLIPNNGLKDTISGTVFFIDPTPTADEKNKECFDKLVWAKQCIFGKDVLKFVNEISFGYLKTDALECLKNEKRSLEILNCYDTRDIENDTTDYNIINYTTIKKLLQ